MSCHPERVHWAIGQPVSDALVARAKREAAATAVRVIYPDTIVTMDYVESRLNLDVDVSGQVTGVRSG